MLDLHSRTEHSGYASGTERIALVRCAGSSANFDRCSPLVPSLSSLKRQASIYTLGRQVDDDSVRSILVMLSEFDPRLRPRASSDDTSYCLFLFVPEVDDELVTMIRTTGGELKIPVESDLD